MAKKIMYILYMREKMEMFDISNTDDGSDCLSVSEAGIRNPPIKMTILECPKSIKKLGSISSVSDDMVERENDPVLEKDCLKALLGKAIDWRLTGVSFSTDSINFTLTNAQSQQSFVDVSLMPFDGHLGLSFDVMRNNAPAERYIVNYLSHRKSDETLEISTEIVEFRNGYKYRKYKFRSDDHEIKGVGYPCYIEEY